MTRTIKIVSLIFIALITSAIVSMDLGEPYTAREKAIFTNVYFQAAAIGAVAYSVTESVISSAIVVLIWVTLKFYLFTPESLSSREGETESTAATSIVHPIVIGFLSSLVAMGAFLIERMRLRKRDGK